MFQNEETTVHSLIRMFWRRRRTVALVFCSVMLLTAISVVLLPKKYESHMKLLVKNERAELVVGPNAKDVARQEELTEYDLNSETELLRSTDVLHDVVLRCGLLPNESGVVHAAGEPSPRAVEKAVSSLRNNLTVAPVRKSNVIEVSYLSKSPESAYEVMQELSERYLQEHLNLHGTPGTQEFFRQQAGAYEEQLRRNDANLSEFRRRYGITTMPEEMAAVLKRSMEASGEFDAADAAVHEYQHKVAEAEAQIAATQSRVLTQSRESTNQYSVEHLHTMLVDLQNRRTDLVAKFRSDDRLVTTVDQQIAEVQAALEQAKTTRATEETTDINPLHEDLKKDLATARMELAGALARRVSLARDVTGYRERLATLEGVSPEYDGLMREARLSEEDFLLHMKKEEEARIADALDKQKIANVAIVEHPVVPQAQASPKPLLDMALGFVLAVFASFGAAIGLEYLEKNSAKAPLIAAA